MAAIRPGRPVAKRRPPQAEAPVVPPPPPAPPAQGRSLTLPAVVVGFAVLLGAFLLRGGGADAEGGAESPETPTAEVTFEGEVLNLDPITLNLADGKIVRVAIALQLVADLPGAEEAVEAPASYGARALDETITVLGGLTRTELLRPGGVADAKETLSARVSELYGGEVLAVYLTQLVVASSRGHPPIASGRMATAAVAAGLLMLRGSRAPDDRDERGRFVHDEMPGLVRLNHFYGWMTG